MIEYRRGIAGSRKNDLWHWNPECQSYPMGAFVIRKDKPSDDDLCARCGPTSREVRP